MSVQSWMHFCLKCAVFTVKHFIFMFIFLMNSQVVLSRSHKTTLITLVFNSLVFGLLVKLETTSLGCSIITLVTIIFDPLVYGQDMSLETTFVLSLELALITRIPDSHVMHENMGFQVSITRCFVVTLVAINHLYRFCTWKYFSMCTFFVSLHPHASICSEGAFLTQKTYLYLCAERKCVPSAVSS